MINTSEAEDKSLLSGKVHVISVIVIGLISGLTGVGLLISNVLLPPISSKIFEQLIQLNATIIGFTIVGIIYYMGRSNDLRREQIITLKELVSKFKPGANKASFTEQFKATVEGHKELFDEVVDVIEFYTITIVSQYAVAISLCFIALLSNELNRSSFILFVIVTELILSTAYFYGSLWRELKGLEKEIYKIIEDYIESLPDLDETNSKEGTKKDK